MATAESRYMCSHPSHAAEGPDAWPRFRTWTDLRAHNAEAHPPTCPYAQCSGRQFKKTRYLREHLKVHSERGDEVDEPDKNDACLLSSDDELSVSADKRRRRRSSTAGSGAGTPKRLKRIPTESSIGKDWPCGEDDCAKSFKSRRALAVHHQTAHLALRPYACTYEGCDHAYGHKHLLQRHVGRAHHRHEEETSSLIATQPEADDLNLLAGSLFTSIDASKTLFCPHVGSSLPGDETEAAEPCQYRFSRLYDLRRHMRKVHAVDLENDELALLLRDALRA